MRLIDVMHPETVDRLKSAGIFNKIDLSYPNQNVDSSSSPDKKVFSEFRTRPILLICETINVCNSLCVFCPYSKQSRPKGTMTIELFEKIIQEYRKMGGGILSLTPMVGDILLDRKLIQRLEILHQYKTEIIPSMTTNLFALDRFSDEEIIKLLDTFARIHISCYGLSPEENQQITKTQNYPNFIANMQRFIELWDKTERTCDVQVGFRLLYDHQPSQLDSFLETNFSHIFPYSSTHTYANWGNSMSGHLPGKAEWMPEVDNRETCILLLVAMQIYWNGRVSACACCDYDSSEELFLGDVNQEKLIDLFNGYLNQKLWSQHETGNLPDICRKCTFHQPLNTLDKDHVVAVSPIDFIGG
jgi:Radical SAM superfamily/Iron-sulfur cluster-binding domain